MAAIIIAAANSLIADASPLIALARVNGLSWLEALFGQVLVTEEVMAEVLNGGYPAREELIDERRPSGCGGLRHQVGDRGGGVRHGPPTAPDRLRQGRLSLPSSTPTISASPPP